MITKEAEITKEINHMISQIQVFKNNSTYRFGDIFFEKGFAAKYKKDIDTILKEKKYKGTILYSYLKKVKLEPHLFKKENECIKMLHSIVVQQKIKSDEEALYVNIRAGDIIEENHYHRRVFMFSRDILFMKIKNQLRQKNIKKIKIITAMHYGANDYINKYFFNEASYNKNCIMLSHIISQINKRFNIPVEICNDNKVNEKLIDYHFSLLSLSSNCIFDKSGFANLAEKINRFHKKFCS